MKEQVSYHFYNTFDKRYKRLRMLLILSFILTFIRILPEVFLFNAFSLIAGGALMLCILVAFYFNEKKKIDISSNILLASISLTLLMACIQQGVHSFSLFYFTLLIIFIPFLINGTSKVQVLFHLALNAGLYFIAYFVDFSFLDIKPSTDITPYVATYNVVLIMLMMAFFIWFFYNDTKRVEETIVASNESIYLKNEELEKRNKELDQIVYSISHDLRAPIASSLGLIEISKKEDDLQKLRHYLHLNEVSLLRTNHFIINILNFLKNNRMELTIEQVNIEEEVKAAIEMNSDVNTNVTFNLNINVAQAFYTDATRLRMIFNNLISNAIRYSKPHQKNTIKISVLELDSRLNIEISDEGIGIAEASINKVFDMFYKTNAVNRGNGLGLYITREAVLKLKGTISVTSELNMGTIFFIQLPNLKLAD
jgi:signal transduction histidine kinase